jgi:hypothetical protein
MNDNEQKMRKIMARLRHAERDAETRRVAKRLATARLATALDILQQQAPAEEDDNGRG